MRITFHGAAGGVTGSKHIIEHDGARILLECGMHQGHWKESYEQNKELPFDATSIDAVILSHAHIDHSGLLPVLAKNGFRGTIYTTPQTKELLSPLLSDAAAIQREDAIFWRSRAAKDPSVVALDPLFSADDVAQTLSLMETHPLKKTFRVAGIADVTFYNAGHILGSAQVQVTIDGKTIGFTGDLGPRNRKILHEAEPLPHADLFLTEGTYGGRIHDDMAHARDTLAKVIRDTHSRRGKVIIPSFALERTQELLYDLHRLYDQKKVPRLPLFVDSPLATDFTKIFRDHAQEFDEETHDFFLDKNKNPFVFKRLTHTESTRDSKKLNSYNEPCIIIAGSGMCEAGRIKHHLKHGLGDPRNTILFVGYQAEHTLGRAIVEGTSPVRVSGKEIDVEAHVESIRGYSAHADQTDLIDNIRKTKGIKKVCIVHADPEQAIVFKSKIEEELPGITVSIPSPGDTIDL